MNDYYYLFLSLFVIGLGLFLAGLVLAVGALIQLRGDEPASILLERIMAERDSIKPENHKTS